MASAVSICNLALSRLGDSATIASIDPPEGSAQAEHCAVFYPMALGHMLERHGWRFATRRAALALLEANSWDWRHAYAVPSTMIRAMAVLLPTDAKDAESQPFESETAADGTPLILTNVGQAVLRYTVQVDDPTKFPPLFVDALSWLVASYVAGPLLKGESGAAAGKACLQQFERVLSLAIASDANQKRLPDACPHTPWLVDR